MKYYELMGLAVLYIALRCLPKHFYVYLLLTIIIGGTTQAIYGALQLWGYYPSHHSGFRMTGSFFNPGPYAGYLASAFPIALGIYLFRARLTKPFHARGSFRIPFTERVLDANNINEAIRSIIFVYLPLIGCFSIALVLPASQSRAAWLAVIVSSAVLLGIRYKTRRITFDILNTRWKKFLATILVTISVGAGGYGLYQFKQGSADGRLLIWKVTSNMISDHPWIGVGYDRFKAHYMNYQAQYFKDYSEDGEEMVAGESLYAFNEFLGFAAEQGLAGILLIVVLIVMLLGGILKRKIDVIGLIACSGLLAVFTFSMFSYPGEILPIKICLVVCLIILVSEHMALRQISLKPRLIFKIGLVLAICGVLGYGLKASIRLKATYKTWQTTFNTYQFGLYEESVEEYKKLYPVLNKNGEYLVNYGKALSMAGKHEEALTILGQAVNYYSSTILETAKGDSYKALVQYDEAEVAYIQAGDMIPSRFYPKYLLAKLYQESGDEESAIGVANILIEKKEKVPSTAIEEIRKEMRELVEAYKTKNSS